MSISEMSDQFDVLYNNITSNQAPGLNEYEKSLFLTKAEKEIVKNYFTASSKGNSIGLGFDDTAKRQADFSVLMQTANCTIFEPSSSAHTIYKIECFDGDAQTTLCLNEGNIYLVNGGSGAVKKVTTLTMDTHYTVRRVGTNGSIPEHLELTHSSVDYWIIGWPFSASNGGQLTVTRDTTFFYYNGKINQKSTRYQYPNDVFIPINETVITTAGKQLQVVPLRFDEYMKLMSKPYKYPPKNQAWRLMNSGDAINTGVATKKLVEIIVNPWDTVGGYMIRYIRVPAPIIVGSLAGTGLTIDNQTAVSTKCEVDPILHEDILQRAVELAKIAWQGDVNTTMQSGQRSE